MDKELLNLAMNPERKDSLFYYQGASRFSTIYVTTFTT